MMEHQVVDKDALVNKDVLSAFMRCVNDEYTLHYKQNLKYYNNSHYGRDYIVVLTLMDDTIKACSLIRKQGVRFGTKFKYYIERGPVAGDMQYLLPHIRFIIDNACDDALWLRVNPYLPYAGTLPDQLRAEGFCRTQYADSYYDRTIVVDLRPDIEQIYQALRKSMKTQINRARKSGVEVRPLTDEKEFLEFVSSYDGFAVQAGLPRLSASNEMRAIATLIYQEQCGVCLAAYCDNRLIAGIMLFYCGERAIYEYGFRAADIENKKLPMMHLLQWEAIKLAKEKGFKYYDFGGMDAAQGSEGINRFKFGFSKTVHELVPNHTYFVRPFAGRLVNYLYRSKVLLRRMLRM